MTLRWLSGTAGLALSLALHVAAGGALWLALRPDPIEQQSPPETRLAMETREIRESTAAEAQPDAAPAREDAPDPAALATGAIPTSRATPSAPSATPLPEAARPAEPLAEAPRPAQLLEESAERPAPLDPTPPTPPALQAAMPVAEQGPEATPQSETLPSARPDPQRATATTAPTTRAAPAAPPIRTAEARPARPEPARPASLPVQSATTTAPAPQAAPAAEAPIQTLANLATESDPLAPSSPQPQRAEPETAPTLIAARAEPTPDRLPAATARPAILDAAEVPQAMPAALALPETAPLTQTQPAPTVTPEAAPDAPRLPDTPAPTEQAASPAPDPQPVAPTEGPVTRGRATLAFEGMAELSDPVSVAAVQSFMAPGTLPEGEDVRDGMSALLSGVPCARLQARFRPETGALELIGHVPEDGAAAPVLAALRDRMGADIPVTSNLRVLPRPQCQVLGAVEAVGLPQSTDQITNRLLVGEDTHAREFRYAEGDRLVLDLSAPDYDAYLYVDYFDASGQVIHLQPNETVPLALVPAKSAQQVGARNEREPGLSITIGPPYGQELAVAFAASEPLYDEPRPLVEPAGPYLDFLRDRIAAAREADPGFRGEWVYFLVVTRPS